MVVEHPILIPDSWLTDLLQKDSYQVNLDEDLIHRPEDRALKELRTLPGFFYAKVPTSNTPAFHFLEKLGFFLIDTNLVFDKLIQTTYASAGNCDIRMARMEDREAVMAVARENFRFTRFHLDPSIPKETADTIKAEWAGNYFSGKRGDAMIVAVVDGQVVGFNQVLKDEQGNLTIDLIAVDANHRQKGIAQDMILFSESEYGDQGTKIRVGTQVANIPSVRLYEKMGFRLCDSKYVFHCHRS